MTAPDQPGLRNPVTKPTSGNDLRDSIRDAFHTINPDCVAYHATDCIDCTMRADTVMAEMRAEAAKERLNDIREEGRDL